MPKKIAKKLQAGLSTMTIDQWTTGVNVSSQVTALPTIYLVQAKSFPVEQGASEGDWWDSLGNRCIAQGGAPLEVLIFYKTDFILRTQHKDQKDKGEFISRTPLTSDMTELPPYEETIPGTTGFYRNKSCSYFFAFVKEGENWDMSMPYVIPFKGSGFKVGKQITSQIYLRNMRQNLPPCAYSLILKPIKMSDNSGNTWSGVQYTPGAEATAEMIKECSSWLEILRSDTTMLDNSLQKADSGEEGQGTNVQANPPQPTQTVQPVNTAPVQQTVPQAPVQQPQQAPQAQTIQQAPVQAPPPVQQPQQAPAYQPQPPVQQAPQAQTVQQPIAPQQGMNGVPKPGIQPTTSTTVDGDNINAATIQDLVGR